MPDSKSLWKEFCKAMRAVEGHNSRNRPTVDKYWSKEGPLDWPGEPIFVIPETDKWPKHKALKALATAPSSSTGKKPLSVSGKKYSQRGGYSAKLVGPGLQPGLATAFVEAANFSLASSTWRSYSSVWRQVGRIAAETGVKFRFPMTTVMVRSLVGALIKNGLKSGTVVSYMSSIKRAHKLRGMETSALDDEVVRAAIKGMRNKEAMSPVPRAVISLSKMSEARNNLKKLKISSRRKKTIWAALVFPLHGKSAWVRDPRTREEEVRPRQDPHGKRHQSREDQDWG